MKHIELARRAEKDLRQLDKPTRQRIIEVLRACLATEPPPSNTDIKALRGADPWLRLRVGTHRVLCRALTTQELRRLTKDLPHGDQPTEGFLVGRIIHRRDLDRAAGTL